jgi:hypothetical protein
LLGGLPLCAITEIPNAVRTISKAYLVAFTIVFVFGIDGEFSIRLFCAIAYCELLGEKEKTRGEGELLLFSIPFGQWIGLLLMNICGKSPLCRTYLCFVRSLLAFYPTFLAKK